MKLICGHKLGECGACPRCGACYPNFLEEHVCDDGVKGGDCRVASDIRRYNF